MFWVLIDREKKVKEEVSSRGESLKEEESYDKPTTPFSEVGLPNRFSLNCPLSLYWVIE
jgi:hypothetical protein